MKQNIIIDCDPGVDDALAIAMALALPELEILALTTVFGNMSIDMVTDNALGLLDLAGRPDIPVFKGAAAPLTTEFSGGIPHVHGTDGLGDGGLLKDVRSSQEQPEHAALHMIAAAKRLEKGDGLTIVALGPLTNLALALQLDPEFDTYVKRVVLMGGNAFCPGNATPAAEANMLGDPEAADMVLGARWPTVMVGLDVTHDVLLSSDQITRIATKDSFSGKVAHHAVPLYQAFLKRMKDVDGVQCHDPAAIAYLISPELFQTRKLPVRVEIEGLSRGKTWPSLGDTDDENPKPWRDRPMVEICTAVDGHATSQLIEQILLR